MPYVPPCGALVDPVRKPLCADTMQCVTLDPARRGLARMTHDHSGAGVPAAVAAVRHAPGCAGSDGADHHRRQASTDEAEADARGAAARRTSSAEAAVEAHSRRPAGSADPRGAAGPG